MTAPRKPLDARTAKVSRFYMSNVVLPAPSGSYYFVPKAELLGGGMMKVIGRKYDVTESVEALIDRAIAKKGSKP